MQYEGLTLKEWCSFYPHKIHLVLEIWYLTLFYMKQLIYKTYIYPVPNPLEKNSWVLLNNLLDDALPIEEAAKVSVELSVCT
jgi:hypothetical protein